jgi:hypothetical protein
MKSHEIVQHTVRLTNPFDYADPDDAPVAIITKNVARERILKAAGGASAHMFGLDDIVNHAQALVIRSALEQRRYRGKKYDRVWLGRYTTSHPAKLVWEGEHATAAGPRGRYVDLGTEVVNASLLPYVAERGIPGEYRGLAIALEATTSNGENILVFAPYNG